MLKNMKIGRRLTLVFALVVILSSIAGVVGVVLLNETDKAYSVALVDYGFAQGDIGNLGRHIQRSRADFLYLLSATNETDEAAYRAVLDSDDAAIDVNMLAVKNGLTSDSGRKIYSELEAALNSYRTVRNDVTLKTANMDTDSSIALANSACAAASNKLTGIVDSLMAEKTSIGTAVSTQLSAQSLVFNLIMIGIIIVSVIIAFVLSIIIGRGISKPIAQVESAAKEMALGNYDVHFDYDSRDEIGSLTKSMRTMTEGTKSVISDTSRVMGEIADGNFDTDTHATYVGVFKGIETSAREIISSLNSTMQQINEAAEQVSAGSDQVSSGAQALSQGATEQASAVEELSATITEISNQIKNNAQNATVAKKEAEIAGTQIVSSNSQMQSMIDAMNDISTKSGEIGKIIKTIDDIAFQTNILALNAAVEAARAGAAGKGFAVVADEVRNLAGKSASAAKNTAVLIEEAIAAVKNGTDMADRTATAMLAVVDAANGVVTKVDEIAGASNEQANAITQVTMGVEQISSVVQTNSATSEESAAASEELNGQAQMLRQLVSKFRLKDSGRSNSHSINLGFTGTHPVPNDFDKGLGGKY